MRVIISAAGTGGHINPGIAIANKIREKETPQIIHRRPSVVANNFNPSSWEAEAGGFL